MLFFAKISAGVVSLPIVYNLYTTDQLTTPYTKVADFVDDNIIYSSHNDLKTGGKN